MRDEQPDEPSATEEVRAEGGQPIQGLAVEFRLRRPRVLIEDEFARSSTRAAERLTMEVLLDIRDLMEERLPLPAFVAMPGTLPPLDEQGHVG